MWMPASLSTSGAVAEACRMRTGRAGPPVTDQPPPISGAPGPVRAGTIRDERPTRRRLVPGLHWLDAAVTWWFRRAGEVAPTRPIVPAPEVDMAERHEPTDDV